MHTTPQRDVTHRSVPVPLTDLPVAVAASRLFTILTSRCLMSGNTIGNGSSVHLLDYSPKLIRPSNDPIASRPHFCGTSVLRLPRSPTQCGGGLPVQIGLRGLRCRLSDWIHDVAKHGSSPFGVSPCISSRCTPPLLTRSIHALDVACLRSPRCMCPVDIRL